MRLKTLLAFGLMALVLIGGFYFGYKRYSAKHRFESSKQEVEKLVAHNEIRDGDIIFQTSLSKQSRAIQLATHSEYSHCGLIYKNGSDYVVLEAVQPVKLTPLDNWIAKGQSGHYVIKRLKNADSLLTPEVIHTMKQIGDELKGKNYDLYFEWSDDKIYCSELVWKIYQRATGIELGKLQKLRDFDLTNDAVKEKMKERSGNNIPLDETVISPASIFNSTLLVTVASN